MRCYFRNLVTVVLTLLTVSLTLALSNNKISRSLHQQLSRSSSPLLSWNIVIQMADGTINPDPDPDFSIPSPRFDIITDLRSTLIDFALTSQNALMSSLLSPRVANHTISGLEQLWISNEIWVRGADEKLITLLASHPDVAYVKEEVVFYIPIAVQEDVTLTLNETIIDLDHRQQTPVAWGVAKVGAGESWSFNNTGQGVILGHIDTGARGTHRILRDSFLGPVVGWYDPENGSKDPIETSKSSHGTHTLGTAVGAEGYGMAPGAKWISCVACPFGECKEALVKRCAQFLLCPNNPSNVTIEKCTNTPHIVVNSWGTSYGGGTAFDTVIENWRRAGIIPVFSAGNSLPPYPCGTLGSPGDHKDVIGVGSTEEDDSLSASSGLGPPVRYQSNQVFKPDLVAPGVGIRSSIGSGDDDFGTISGTSMAAPHVAGAIALILFRKPGMSFDQVKNTLFDSAKKDELMFRGGVDCGGVSERSWPNHKFGNGRLDVRGAMGGAVGVRLPISGIALVALVFISFRLLN